MTYDMISPDERRTVGVQLTDAELAEIRAATNVDTNAQAVASAARAGARWLKAVAAQLARAVGGTPDPAAAAEAAMAETGGGHA